MINFGRYLLAKHLTIYSGLNPCRSFLYVATGSFVYTFLKNKSGSLFLEFIIDIKTRLH